MRAFRPEDRTSGAARVGERSRRRARSHRLLPPRHADDRFAKWASHFGLEPKALDSDEKDDLIAELDAAVSLLYGLSDRDVRHIFETFHGGGTMRSGSGLS